MAIVSAVILGIIQGLTEFLPVSSTAHMAIASRLLYHEDVGAAFSAIVQLGPIDFGPGPVGVDGHVHPIV